MEFTTVIPLTSILCELFFFCFCFFDEKHYNTLCSPGSGGGLLHRCLAFVFLIGLVFSKVSFIYGGEVYGGEKAHSPGSVSSSHRGDFYSEFSRILGGVYQTA